MPERAVGERRGHLGAGVGPEHAGAPERREPLAQRREREVLAAHRFADADDPRDARRGGLYAARGERLGDRGEERRDADQRRGAVAQDELGQKGDGAGPAPDGRRPEAGQPQEVGQPGHEAAVERRGDEHPLAGADAGGAETGLSSL